MSADIHLCYNTCLKVLMGNVVICLLKMRAVMSFAECIGPSLRTARLSFLFLHTCHCDKDVNETPAGYPPHALQWNSAACSCSMDILRVWGRYVLCLLLLLYRNCLAGNTCIVTNLPLIQGGFFSKVL